MCEFEDGAIVESDFTNISKGNLKSPNFPNVFNVGYLGQGKWKCKINGSVTKEYTTWHHMMERCYSEKAHLKSNAYVDVTVCDRWHNFQNFCDDIVYLDGYDLWKNGEYELDKDFLCEKLGLKNKIYSPTTCKFIPRPMNISEATTRKNLTGNTYVGISPNGTIYEYENKKKFANEHTDISYSSIDRCLNENRKIKGWIFKIKN